jgi:predicted lipid-binding transport protein (Tim44 family)
MHNFQFLDVVVLAVLTGFIAFRLYSVLGRRTGHERSPEDRVRRLPGAPSAPQPVNPQAPSPAPQAADNVVALPERAGAAAANPALRGILDIKLADRAFDTDHFLSGARAAYEMIVTAFAHGERATLQPLLSPEVFETFESAIKGREARSERVDFTFLSLKSARVTAADLKGGMAEIGVAFESEVMLAGYDPAGALIEGDAKTPHAVTETWTFARNTRSSDPNWTLVATAPGA